MTTVLITRPLPDATRFAEDCARQEIDCVVAPLMRFERQPGEIDLTDIEALAFTSANGVRAFAAKTNARALKVYAVGPASAAAAQKAGFEDISAAQGDVAALAALIMNDPARPSGSILHAAGASLAGDLIGRLSAASIPARRAVIYEMKEALYLPAPARAFIEDAGDEAWVALFSPRSAALFLRLAQDAALAPALAKLKAACLSAAVADSVKLVSWRAVETAKAPNSAALLALMRPAP